MHRQAIGRAVNAFADTIRLRQSFYDELNAELPLPLKPKP